jgi:hypothetical protein
MAGLSLASSPLADFLEHSPPLAIYDMFRQFMSAFPRVNFIWGDRRHGGPRRFLYGCAPPPGQTVNNIQDIDISIAIEPVFAFEKFVSHIKLQLIATLNHWLYQENERLFRPVAQLKMECLLILAVSFIHETMHAFDNMVLYPLTSTPSAVGQGEVGYALEKAMFGGKLEVQWRNKHNNDMSAIDCVFMVQDEGRRVYQLSKSPDSISLFRILIECYITATENCRDIINSLMGTGAVLSIRHIAEVNLQPAPLKSPKGYIRRRLDGSLSPDYSQRSRQAIGLGLSSRLFKGDNGVTYFRSSIDDGGCIRHI